MTESLQSTDHQKDSGEFEGKNSRLESKKRYRIVNSKICIEIKVKSANQLFDTRDPAPFHERDLDDDAVTYIISSVDEFPLKTPMKLVIHLSDPLPIKLETEEMKAAIHRHFENQSDLLRKKVKLLIRRGRGYLLTGLITLFVCLMLANILRGLSDPWSFIIREGLVISGWVAMWKPMDLFLYAWRPFYYERKTCEKLSQMEIEVNQEFRSN